MLNSNEHGSSTSQEKELALKLLDAVFILLINVKMPTIVGILTFMSMIKCTLSPVELSMKTR